VVASTLPRVKQRYSPLATVIQAAAHFAKNLDIS
jgi:hypothetical protein